MNDSDERTRKEAIARSICVRVCDELRTIDDLRAIDELLTRLARDDRRPLEDILLSMLYNEDEHPGDDHVRAWNAAMRQAIRSVMVDRAVAAREPDPLPPTPTPDVIEDMANRLDVARTKSEEIKREAARQTFDTSDTEPPT